MNPRSSVVGWFEERSVAQLASSPGARNKGKRQRKLTEEQYDAFLAGYGPGDYGEAELDEGENRLTVRNRFKAAAARRGLSLTFRRTNRNLLHFRLAPAVVAEVAPAVEPEPSSTPQAAPKGRGGRRKAAAPSAR